MDSPQDRPELFHPALRDKSRSYVVLRSSMFSKWWYPADEQVGWFGDVRMYCTLPQYVAWCVANPPAKTDVKIGPG